MNKKAHQELQSLVLLLPILILIWFSWGRIIICLVVLWVVGNWWIQSNMKPKIKNQKNIHLR